MTLEDLGNLGDFIGGLAQLFVRELLAEGERSPAARAVAAGPGVAAPHLDRADPDTPPRRLGCAC